MTALTSQFFSPPTNASSRWKAEGHNDPSAAYVSTPMTISLLQVTAPTGLQPAHECHSHDCHPPPIFSSPAHWHPTPTPWRPSPPLSALSLCNHAVSDQLISSTEINHESQDTGIWPLLKLQRSKMYRHTIFVANESEYRIKNRPLIPHTNYKWKNVSCFLFPQEKVAWHKVEEIFSAERHSKARKEEENTSWIWLKSECKSRSISFAKWSCPQNPQNSLFSYHWQRKASFTTGI